MKIFLLVVELISQDTNNYKYKYSHDMAINAKLLQIFSH